MLGRVRGLSVAGAALMMTVAAMARAPSMSDKQWVRTAIETNQAEIAAAHLALTHSDSQDVKQFAHRMIHDHTQLNLQMKPLAQQLDVQVAPGEVTAHQQQVADQLKGLHGKAFDQQYIAAMVKGHEKAVHETQTEASQSQFPPVKNAAKKALPVLQTHLRLARKLAKAHNVQVGAD